MAREFALEAHGIGKRYRRRRPWALRDLDLAVPTGSITALVGPNGAGKSTLIKGCIGFERPTAGRLLVDGVDPWRDRAEALRRVGYVPQAASLYRELSVADHLSLAARWRPGFDRGDAERRLDQLDIPLDARADELSGGQQAQVGLAIALGTRAPVLLLDEPLASLDPLARREFLHVLVDAVRASGATALLSSHVITDIEQACDRLVVLGGGRPLLDVSMEAARAGHRVVDGRRAAGRRATSSGGSRTPMGCRSPSSRVARGRAARRRSRRSCSGTSRRRGRVAGTRRRPPPGRSRRDGAVDGRLGRPARVPAPAVRARRRRGAGRGAVGGGRRASRASSTRRATAPRAIRSRPRRPSPARRWAAASTTCRRPGSRSRGACCWPSRSSRRSCSACRSSPASWSAGRAGSPGRWRRRAAAGSSPGCSRCSAS